MSSAWLFVLKYGIFFFLALAGVVLILIRREVNRADLPYLVGVALLASAIFSISDVARDYLTSREQALSLPSPLSAHAELRDAEFWLEVFNKLPPTFIKKVEPGQKLTHLIDNPSLHKFQGEPLTDVKLTPELSSIKEDHDFGDAEAATAGFSAQLEYSEPGGGQVPKLILTIKQRFQHRGAYYLVGTYIPVTLDSIPDKNTLTVESLGGQVVFHLHESTEHGLPVHVANSLRPRPAEKANQP
jgi:hypothetical protein